MDRFAASLSDADPAVAALVERERRRQDDGIGLIASENFASRAVLEAVGSPLTNKYAEGYPGRRYYGGCEVVDEVERLAIARCLALFGAEHANVQPHSGSQANDAALAAVLAPGDTVLSLGLDHGGHLTHGHPLSFSGKRYSIVHYGVGPATETVDYDALREKALEVRPKLVICGASAYPRAIDFARVREAADAVGALVLADMAHIAGLVAAGFHASPVPFADLVTFTTHKTLRGPRGGVILCGKQHAAAVDRAVFPGAQGGPLMHVIAGKAVAFGEAADPSFAEYQRRVVDGAAAMARAIAARGFRLVAGGTDTHLILVDTFMKGEGITGLAAETALGKAAITANKNVIPFDTNPPREASGIRLGTPGIMARGMGVAEAEGIGGMVAEALAGHANDAALAGIADRVRALAARFPVYENPVR